MDNLIRLLGIETPTNTTLESAELHFRGGLSLWFAGLILFVIAAAAIFLYRTERAGLGLVRRSALVICRVLLFALLLALLLRPVLMIEFLGERARGIALLVDDSQSMKQRDRRLADADKARVALAMGKAAPGTKLEAIRTDAIAQNDLPRDPSRLELVKSILQNPDWKFLPNLASIGPIRTYSLGSDVTPMDETAAKDVGLAETIVTRLQGEQSRSAVADGIFKVLQSKDADPPAAVVVVTDGLDNASKFTLAEAAREAARLGIPLHVYGVGSTESGLLQLREVAVAETLFVEDLALVPLRYKLQGFKKGTVEITLKLDGKKVAFKEVPVQAGDDLREVLGFTVPKGEAKEETLDLTTEIRLKGNETFKDAWTRSVRVVDRKIKVLFVENAPRWEYKFLQPALLRDRRIEVDFLLVQADPKVARSGPPFLPEFPSTREKFFEAKYNLIILGDVPASYLGKEKLEWIREFVENRGGLIVVSGRQHMPSSYEQTPLAEALPIEFAPLKTRIDPEIRSREYPATMTEVGQRTDMLALADTPTENLEVWTSKLPGFHWNYPITKLRPAATTLLVNPQAKLDDQPMPILVSHYYGKGQVLFLGTDETWRWRWNHQDKYFVRFWGQMIYQLGLPTLLGDGGKRVSVALDRSQAVLGQPGQVYVRLLDKDYNPRKDSTVEASLDFLDAKAGQERSRRILLHALVGRPGEYAALLPHDQPGRFELKISNPETNTFSYRVEIPPRNELEESVLNERGLRELASLSGGRFYREEDLHEMPNSIVAKTTSFTRRQEVLLWNPLAFLLFVVLITVEWLIRKFADLS